MPNVASNPPSRLFVVDRSPVVIEQLRREITADPSIGNLLALVGSSNGLGDLAAEIEAANPDVILFDAGLPPAVTRLAVQLSTREGFHLVGAVESSPAGWAFGMDLLEAGAVDLARRPYTAGSVRSFARRFRLVASAAPATRVPIEPADSTNIPCGATVVIAAGLGGAIALADVLAAFPVGGPGLVALTALPGGAVEAFTDWLDQRSVRRVSVAVDGSIPASDRILIAPGNAHLLLRQTTGGMVEASTKHGPTVHHRRPSADLLFRSLTKICPDRNVVAGMVGGAGMDGVAGLAAVRAAGGRTFIESPLTSRVPEDSQFAAVAAVADRVEHRSRLVKAILDLAGNRPSRRAA